MGITATSDDAKIDSIITRVSAWVEAHLDRGSLSVQSYRETAAGYGTRKLQLERYPIRAVTALWGATDTGEATTYLSSEFKVDHPPGQLVRDQGWAWTAGRIGEPFAVPLSPSYNAGQEEEPWLADYIAGWTYAGVSTDSDNWSTMNGTTSTGRTLPYDIEDAVILRVAQRYERTEGVKSKRVGDLAITYATASDGRLVDPAEDLLSQYRSVV